MSEILDAVVSTVPAKAFDYELTHVAAAVHMTMVKSVRLGCCMTLSDDRVFQFKVNQPVSHLGDIEKLGLKEILKWTNSDQGIERSFAFAALNGSIDVSGKFFDGNALDLAAELGTGKNIAMIGRFPHLERYKERCKNLWILEKRPQAGDLPAEEYVNILPQSDVVIATGVTCLNDTLGGLLKVKKPGSTFIIVGPSVPLSPILFDYGVDVIGGAWVEDEQDVYKKILQGASPRSVKNSLRTILYPKNPELLSACPELELVIRTRV